MVVYNCPVEAAVDVIGGKSSAFESCARSQGDTMRA